MESFTQIIDPILDFTRKQEQAVFKLVETLVHANVRPAASGVLKVEKYSKKNQPFKVEQDPEPNPVVPNGPFKRNRDGALLVYVPRDIEGLLIDDLSGGYGYSHVAIDCGETDEDTGKPVMVESTTGDRVRRRFLNLYGGRHYVRIPLKRMGIDVNAFCECVISKVGQQYDYLEAMTWGRIDDPARQVCSNLATDCLPETIREEIIRKHKESRLSPSAISVHRRWNGTVGLFVSPNAFCQFFSAPPGKNLERAGQVHSPKRGRGISPAEVFWRNRHGWAYFMAPSAVLAGLLLWQWRSKRGLFHLS